MNYVIAAYVFTIALIGGYALSIVLRRRAVERELAARREEVPPGADDPRSAAGRPEVGDGEIEAP